MSKFIFYIALAISVAWVFSFFLEYGNEINQSIISSATLLVNQYPVLTKILALVVSINCAFLAIKIIYKGGLIK